VLELLDVATCAERLVSSAADDEHTGALEPHRFKRLIKLVHGL
jgi:hypothetical protein